MEPVLLIANEAAGAAERSSFDEALAVLREATDVSVAHTLNPGELDGVLHRRGGRWVVVAGGDGSLHAVVAALHRRHELADTVVGLLPLGTGNDFARGCGIPLDAVEAARQLCRTEPVPVDLLVDDVGEIVVNNVHVGIGADASRRGHRWKLRIGRLGYVVGALSASLRPRFLRVRVELDGVVVADLDRRVVQVSVGNGSDVGGGTRLTPDAEPADGRLDLLVSFATGPLARLTYAAQLWLGVHQERHDVLSARGRTVTVAGQPFRCVADGERYGPERHRTWHLEQAAFRMPLP